MKVLVIGGGIIGNAIAWRIARRGIDVTVLERGRAGQEASWAAAGMMAPQAEAETHTPIPFLQLCVAGKQAFESTLDELISQGGIDPEYDQGAGILYVALNDEERSELAARAAWQRKAGLTVEEIDGQQARSLAPPLSAEVISALYFQNENRLENRLLTQAYFSAALRAGANVMEETAAEQLELRGGRVCGLRLANGRLLEGDVVVNAAGSWAGQLAGIEPDGVRLSPVRGQIICFEARPRLLGPAIFSLRGYVVPRRDGRLLAGSTREYAGFSKYVTLEGMDRIARGAIAMLPAMAGIRFREAWAGLRPATDDLLPVIGPSPHFPGLLYATGHFRSGILLSALTGLVIADIVTGEKPQLDLTPFLPARFSHK